MSSQGNVSHLVNRTDDRLGTALRRLVDVLCGADLDDDQAERMAVVVDELAGEAAAQPQIADAATRYFQSSPLVGFRNPVAPPIERRRDEHDRAVCDVVLGARYQGNVGWVHGACVASVWDEVLAVARAPEEGPSVTGTLTIRYRSPTPLDTPLHFVAEVERVEGRKIFATGRCTTPDGTVASEAEAIFIAVDPSMVPAFTEGLTEAP